MLNVKQAKRKLILRIIVVVLTLTCLVSAITFAVVKRPFNNNFEIVDQLGGNIFPLPSSQWQPPTHKSYNL